MVPVMHIMMKPASGWYYQQYIPCLDPLEEERGGHAWSLTP